MIGKKIGPAPLAKVAGPLVSLSLPDCYPENIPSPAAAQAAVIVVRSPDDLPRARHEAEAALHAGRAVNVLAEHQGARSLVARILPVDDGYLAVTPDARTTRKHADIASALQPLAQARKLLEGGQPEHIRGRGL